MGNCQAVDAAVLVIQHPSGKIERLYWPIAASEVMRTNPGHYVSLIIPLPPQQDDHNNNHQDHKNDNNNNTVRFTRVKLLRPNETLNLGHAYRLITTQEVMKVLKAKKHAKTKKTELEKSQSKKGKPEEKDSVCHTKKEGDSNQGKTYQGSRAERNKQRGGGSTNPAAVQRSKSWRPSLQSISESIN